MDRLPKRKDLIFQQARKTFYLQLTAVIRSLGAKFHNIVDQELIWRRIESFQAPILTSMVPRAKLYGYSFCVCAEIDYVIVLYQDFLMNASGDGRRTKKLRAGIRRLEFLRDNWDDLEITGGLKDGYRLVLKPKKS